MWETDLDCVGDPQSNPGCLHKRKSLGGLTAGGQDRSSEAGGWAASQGVQAGADLLLWALGQPGPCEVDQRNSKVG
jgi:hypothetical protein